MGQHSEKLWNQMKWLLSIGKMYLIRDNHLVFHGCVPVDAEGKGYKHTLWAQRFTPEKFFTPGQADQMAWKNGKLVTPTESVYVGSGK